ncbi:MAG: bifunctional DNA-formamidopyrimidine glycosylase/DNA-(apurinic or apyrimidinic site) lyase [Planctomycetota bacterium]|nr:MAG: bifunctional DNA-formamidopyrimidine glycosylase/DNA-(apurinic or apyrimidinic site) lyase [Planctomycetota bacterium]
MPELPEVETTRRSIEPHLLGRRVLAVEVREPRLRWRVPKSLAEELPGQTVAAVERRAKYLLWRCQTGTVLLHLGMSGSLRVLTRPRPPQPHDHLDVVLEGGVRLRLRDPRRFGAVLWVRGDPLRHRLLRGLGPEPLDPGFQGDALFRKARGRSAPVKAFLLDGRSVAGVGNIYATEALFRAGIHPGRPAGRVSLARYRGLAAALREVLAQALAAGGTTLRDFSDSSGEPGWFALELDAYGRAGRPCRKCGGELRLARLAQRSSVYCPRCQR